MAKTIEIVSTKDTFRLAVDGNEIEGVQEYELSERPGCAPTINLTIGVSEKVSVKVGK